MVDVFHFTEVAHTVSEESSEVNAIPIRAAGDELPLFMPHDGAEGVLYAQSLAEHIAPGIPVYALPPGSLQLRTVEAMAAGMIRTMRNVQPVGPYRIAGWGAGGILAYEIAVQLIGEDQTVQFLALIDTDVLGTTRDYVPRPIPIPVHIFALTDSLGQRWRSLLPTGLFRSWNAGDDNCQSQTPIVRKIGALGRNVSEAIRDTNTRPAESLTDSYSALVILQTGSNNRQPLICVPGAGASVTAFLDLIQCLDSGWRVFGLQPRGLEGAMVPHTTVSAAAEFYLKTIHAIVFGKPVHLLGHSFGGWIVYEMALRLLARGHTVASLTILDSEVPGDATIQDYSNIDVMMDWLQTFEQNLGYSLEIKSDDLEARNKDEQLKLIHSRLVLKRLLPRQSQPETLSGPLRTFAASFRATYRPTQCYPERIRLVLAADKEMSGSRCRQSDVTTGWRQWAPKLTCAQVPGNHTTMLKAPNVKALAQLLQDEQYLDGID